MNWETILFLGDSLTVGARSYLGYPEYCGDFLMKKLNKDWSIINHATNGFRAIDLARSVGQYFQALSSNQPLISFVLIGTNDAKSGTPLEDYRIALEQVIIKAKLITLNNNVVLLTLPKLQNGVAYPYEKEMNSFVSIYNTIITELANKHEIKCLSIALEDQHFLDGVHFNKEGTIYFASKISESILHERGM